MKVGGTLQANMEIPEVVSRVGGCPMGQGGGPICHIKLLTSFIKLKCICGSALINN